MRVNEVVMVAKGEETMKGLGTLLFWQYALSAVSMTGLIALFINEVLP